MDRKETCILDLVEKYNSTLKKNKENRKEDIQKFTDDLWYDWFCSTGALFNKTKSLLPKVKAISNSWRFNNKKSYVFFKNNCPIFGPTYDDFRICDMENGNVLFTVIPSEPRNEGLGEVWGRENDFTKPLITGTWKEIKEWFNYGKMLNV